MFIFSTCQAGAENALKKEVKRLFPDWKPAYVRPGFVSFKTSGEAACGSLLQQSMLARSCSQFLGKLSEPQTAAVWRIAAEHQLFINAVHCYRRDTKGFEPHIPDTLLKLRQQLIESCPHPKFLTQKPATVLDVLEIEPDLWFIGVHQITTYHSQYPGGITPLQLPDDAVSRAWLKFEEGIRWAGIEIKPSDICFDIGASPGGCSQVLLARCAKVFGIDPGEMAPAVLKHLNFTHLRQRVKEVKRSLFEQAAYLFADLNVAPNYTLDVLEEIIPFMPQLRAAIFTLKLPDWNLVEQIPSRLPKNALCKQLAFNRQEVMVSVRFTFRS